LILAFNVSLAYSQTIFIANSNPGAVPGTNVFTGANAINNATAVAASGDVIYIIPSGVIYNTPTLTKRLTLIGGGYNPNKPGGAISTINGINIFDSGNGSRVSGIVAVGNVQFNAGGPAVSNIMIDNCRISNLSASIATNINDNIIVQNCIIGDATGTSNFSLRIGSNSRITNNIIYARASGPPLNAMRDVNGAIIEHNIFIGSASGSTTFSFNNVSNCDIRNNIFFGVVPSGNGLYNNNVVRNNISFGASDNSFSIINGNTSVNNIVGQDPLITNLTYGTIFNFSFDLSLPVASPAKTTGLGGVEMGIFGGLTPYNVFGTSLPIVQEITAPATSTQGTNITVRVKAKGN
jgi:hypothetical protein